MTSPNAFALLFRGQFEKLPFSVSAKGRQEYSRFSEGSVQRPIVLFSKPSRSIPSSFCSVFKYNGEFCQGQGDSLDSAFVKALSNPLTSLCPNDYLRFHDRLRKSLFATAPQAIPPDLLTTTSLLAPFRFSHDIKIFECFTSSPVMAEAFCMYIQSLPGPLSVSLQLIIGPPSRSPSEHVAGQQFAEPLLLTIACGSLVLHYFVPRFAYDSLVSPAFVHLCRNESVRKVGTDEAMPYLSQRFGLVNYVPLSRLFVPIGVPGSTLSERFACLTGISIEDVDPIIGDMEDVPKRDLTTLTNRGIAIWILDFFCRHADRRIAECGAGFDVLANCLPIQLNCIHTVATSRIDSFFDRQLSNPPALPASSIRTPLTINCPTPVSPSMSLPDFDDEAWELQQAAQSNSGDCKEGPTDLAEREAYLTALSAASLDEHCQLFLKFYSDARISVPTATQQLTENNPLRYLDPGLSLEFKLELPLSQRWLVPKESRLEDADDLNCVRDALSPIHDAVSARSDRYHNSSLQRLESTAESGRRRSSRVLPNNTYKRQNASTAVPRSDVDDLADAVVSVAPLSVNIPTPSVASPPARCRTCPSPFAVVANAFGRAINQVRSTAHAIRCFVTPKYELLGGVGPPATPRKRAANSDLLTCSPLKRGR